MPLVSFCLSLLDDQQQQSSTSSPAAFDGIVCVDVECECNYWHFHLCAVPFTNAIAVAFARTNSFTVCVRRHFHFACKALFISVQRLSGNTNNASLVNACASRVANAYNKKRKSVSAFCLRPFSVQFVFIRKRWESKIDTLNLDNISDWNECARVQNESQ